MTVVPVGVCGSAPPALGNFCFKEDAMGVLLGTNNGHPYRCPRSRGRCNCPDLERFAIPKSRRYAASDATCFSAGHLFAEESSASVDLWPRWMSKDNEG